MLALKLYNDPATVKDTAFYKNWILPNIDGSSEQAKFLALSNKLLSKLAS